MTESQRIYKEYLKQTCGELRVPPTAQSADDAPAQGETPGVAAVAAWFDVLEAAQDTLHNVQYPLRAMELPSYPAGGVCGIANLGIALDHIVAAQNALDLVRDQLSHWKAMTEAYGSSSNNPDVAGRR